jgi:glucose 1-dehydrogenase
MSVTDCRVVSCEYVHATPTPLLLPGDLQGRRAVVTGAARGIGEAIATWLIMAGAEVTVIDKDEDALKQAFVGTGCQPLWADLSHDDVTTLAGELVRNGPLELIVNNVGITTPQKFLDLEKAEFDEVMRTNLGGPWFFTKRLVEAFIRAEAHGGARRRRGSILFVSSLHDTFVAGEAHYSASKAAVAMLTKELATQLAAYRIRVNAISPGWIRTAADVTTPTQVRKYERLRPRIPLETAGVPADVARLAIFLLSDAWSGYITGQNIAVDGGLALFNWRDGEYDPS